MDKFLRKCSQSLKYGAAIIAGGFYIWALIILARNDNWLGISALTTMLLAIAAFWAIRQNNQLHKKERRERLLHEVIEWVTDIQKASLEVDIPIAEEQIRVREANVLLRFAIPFGRNNYIKSIVSEAFKEELQQDVANMINAFTAFLFLKGKSFGVKGTAKLFKGTAVGVIEAVEKRLKEESLDELLKKYSEEKSKHSNIILNKAGSIVAKP